jgi:hypothetical protein
MVENGELRQWIRAAFWKAEDRSVSNAYTGTNNKLGKPFEKQFTKSIEICLKHITFDFLPKQRRDKVFPLLKYTKKFYTFASTRKVTKLRKFS